MLFECLNLKFKIEKHATIDAKVQRTVDRGGLQGAEESPRDRPCRKAIARRTCQEEDEGALLIELGLAS